MVLLVVKASTWASMPLCIVVRCVGRFPFEQLEYNKTTLCISLTPLPPHIECARGAHFPDNTGGAPPLY